MTIEFSDNIQSDIKDYIATVPFDLRQLNAHLKANNLDEVVIKVTENRRFQCEVAYNTILLSEQTIEIIWFLTYSHWYFYELYCKGVKPDGQTLSLTDTTWNISKEMLRSAVNALASNTELHKSDNFPRTFFEKSELGEVSKYALLFFLCHELFHLKWNGQTQDALEEEDNCDKDAADLILNASLNHDYLSKAKGVCIGLMLLNVYGIHTNNFDGKTHPYSYDRLINILTRFFGPENDKIWGLAVSIFSLHMTEKEIAQPSNEFDNFYDCIQEYKRILESNARS